MQKIERAVLIFIGGMLIALTLMWDVMEGNPFNITPIQMAPAILGVFIAVLGIRPNRVILTNIYVLSALIVIGLFALELVLPKSYSMQNLTLEKEFDHQLDKFNKTTIFPKNIKELDEIGIKNELGLVYKKTWNSNIIEKSGYRILILGDSFIMGDGMPWGTTWDGMVINYLNQMTPEVELFSFGRNGLATLEEFDFLMENIEILQPDLVVFSFVSNDPHFKQNEETKMKKRILFINYYAKATGYVYQFKSLNFLYNSINNLFVSFYPYYGYVGWVKRLYEPRNFSKYEELLQKIKSASLDRKFKLLFYLFPSRSYQSNPLKSYLTKVENALKKSTIAYLNPNENFESMTHTFSKDHLSANPGDGHPGVVTNFLATQYFISHLCDEGLMSEGCEEIKPKVIESLHVGLHASEANEEDTSLSYR